MTRRRAITILLIITIAVTGATGFTLGRHRTATILPAQRSNPAAVAGPTISRASDDAHTQPGDGAASEQATPDAGDQPGDTPHSETVQARAQWEPVVVEFGHAF